MLKTFKSLSNCKLCPHNCGIDRYSNKTGYCGSNAGFNISSIVLHKGEEPVISGKNGICNIFFSRCNLQCIYCQNKQISCNKGDVISRNYKLEEAVNEIIAILDQHKINSVGFVSPSHYVPHVISIIEALRSKGRNPITVYNTNAYDKESTIRQLESYISVYLPDFKYIDEDLAKSLSGVSNYPEIAKKAIKEMFYQKGSTLIKNEDGIAESGLIIRHLVLPEKIENSLNVLRFIAEELSPDISLSLMAQYHPVNKFESYTFLNRKLNTEEYEIVVKESENLGFHRGWNQELDSSDEYLPDFNNKQPFEKQM
ncbi:MAG: radical SAM protein [Bacteroidales bacterium]